MVGKVYVSAFQNFFRIENQLNMKKIMSKTVKASFNRFDMSNMSTIKTVKASFDPFDMSNMSTIKTVKASFDPLTSFHTYMHCFDPLY